MRDDASVVDDAILAIALAVIPVQRRYQRRILRNEARIGRYQRFLDALGREMDTLLQQARDDVRRKPHRAADIVAAAADEGRKLTIRLGEVA